VEPKADEEREKIGDGDVNPILLLLVSTGRRQRAISQGWVAVGTVAAES